MAFDEYQHRALLLQDTSLDTVLSGSMGQDFTMVKVAGQATHITLLLSSLMTPVVICL